MAKTNQDIWFEWLLHRRFGGDPQRMQTALEYLSRVRDRVLKRAALAEGETLLDIGCGDGLIAFGALEQVKTAAVIFSDISPDLLNHVQALAREMGAFDRCRFLCAPADDLSALDDSSVDVVTTRSVLIYVPAKQKAFDEFHRVLKPGGRLSIFEPINRFSYPEPPHLYAGFDVTPVMEIADKVKALYLRLQPLESDPMLDFDERDLLVLAEKAGFKEIQLELRVKIVPPEETASWAAFLRSPGNPKIPSLEEAMNQVLSREEMEAFTAHLRPLVEAKQGVSRSAVAYLWAVKG